MIVAAWFIFVGLVILFGFGLLIATFINWVQQTRLKKKSEAAGAEVYETREA
jgi:hypothetical protein